MGEVFMSDVDGVVHLLDEEILLVCCTNSICQDYNSTT